MTRRHLLIGLLLMLALTACSGEPLSTPGARPTFAPTATTEITAVPLLLTPIATPEALPGLPPLTNPRSSRSLALHDNLLITVNTDSGSISLVNTRDLAVSAEVPVGSDPRTVAITPDGSQALVTLRGDNALAVVDVSTQTLSATIPIGHMPYGVVTDGRRAYVSNFADDQIAILDLESGDVIYRLDVGDSPAGLLLSDDWLFVTHFYNGHVSVLNIERTPFLLGAVNAEPDGNLARAIIAAPDGERVYIPQTRTGLALVSLQYMQDWFPVVSVLDIATMTGDRAARLTISMLEYAANMPFDAAFTPDGERLYVVLAGSDAVLPLQGADFAPLPRLAVGSNPRGIVIDPDGARGYVLNALNGTISVLDLAANAVTDTVTVTEIPLDPQLLYGKILFHHATAPQMSDGAISCATCHFDGGADGRTWINFRSGPRNTPALGGAADLPPYNWAGDMAELHDTIEDHIRTVMLGDGLIMGDFDPTIDRTDAGRSEALDALTAYVASFEPWPSPYREPDGSLSPAAQRGMQLFMSGSPDCGCHAPPSYADGLQHNLAGAAFAMEVFEDFDTPTLHGIWATAPYMHDGVVQSLEELLTRTDPVHSVAGGLTQQQIDDLIAFLLSL